AGPAWLPRRSALVRPGAWRQWAPPPRAARFFRFRLDYLIKVGVLRKLGGIRVGLGAIALSIVSLGRAPARPEPRVARARRSRRAAHVAGRAQGRDRRLGLPLRLLAGPRLGHRRAAGRD